MTRSWPPALLQPDPSTGCIDYAVAYLCHCLGHPEVTPADVCAFNDSHICRYDYPKHRFGAEMETYWKVVKDEQKRRWWWLGKEGRPWVEDWLQRGYLGAVTVERVQGRAHAVIVLDGDDDGVLLMDPLYGHCVEPWDWFLSVGAGNHNAHHLNGWYKL